MERLKEIEQAALVIGIMAVCIWTFMYQLAADTIRNAASFFPWVQISRFFHYSAHKYSRVLPWILCITGRGSAGGGYI